MKFGEYFLLWEISQKKIDELALSNIKLPWDNIFGDKMRMKMDYVPDYSFLNTDEIIYVKDKKAFFKTKDSVQKNKLKLSKAIKPNEELIQQKLKKLRLKNATEVAQIFKKYPEESDALAKITRYPLDMYIDDIQKNGIKRAFWTAYIINRDANEIIKYIIPDFPERVDNELELLDELEDLSLMKNSTEKYSLIISRAPIDVLRASDYKNIQSCMSPKSKASDDEGIHYRDLCKNVQMGAGIVYILPELNISDQDLQNPEIFKDVERQIEGHLPIARVLIRQFINRDDKSQLMVPEVRVFGSMAYNLKQVIYKDVVKHLREIQGIQQIEVEKYDLVGSTYIDTEINPHMLLLRFNIA